jgi:ATP-dependent 26S proteasome regulatory subunit
VFTYWDPKSSPDFKRQRSKSIRQLANSTDDIVSRDREAIAIEPGCVALKNDRQEVVDRTARVLLTWVSGSDAKLI